ncbi:MAG TPA: extracellular solute-binding protein [Burkholderiaceae bacterium]|nr:extracellular solute-binding protein [Burkholderiaceae bacterium]
MNEAKRYWRLARCLLAWTCAAPAWSQQQLTLAAAEQPPYVGQALPDGGYVTELVTEALRRRGYQVRVVFYPWARAVALAVSGQVDGVMPVDRAFPAAAGLVYSAGFPGASIGLIKLKSVHAPPGTLSDVLAAAVKPGQRYGVGAVRGGMGHVDPGGPAELEMAGDDLRNLDKLAAGRLRYSVIDRYSAADLIVGQRPHLIGKFDFVSAPEQVGQFAVALSTRAGQYRQALAAFNQGLAEMVRDGSVDRIRDRHGLFRPPAATPGKVMLTVGTVDNADMLILKRMSPRFERLHPGIRLNWRVLDENTLRLRQHGDMAIGGHQYDVVTIGTYEVPKWARDGWIAPVGPLPPRYEVDDLVPSVRAALSYSEQLYALPLNAESVMTYYRKDLFERAGLVMPARPGFQALAELAQRLHRPLEGQYGICLRGKAGWGENMAVLTMLVHSFGGRWFDQQWRPELTSPAWQATLQWYLAALLQSGPPHPERLGFNELQDLFADGHCAIWVDSTVAAGVLFDKRRSRVADQLGYAAAPAGPDGAGGGWLWSWALAIPSTSLQRDAARQFIAWATSKDYIREVARRFGPIAVPPGARRSTYADRAYRASAPFSQFVLDAIESADSRRPGARETPEQGLQYVAIPEFPAIGNQVALEMAAALRGEQSADSALRRAQSECVELMRNATYSRK